MSSNRISGLGQISVDNGKARFPTRPYVSGAILREGIMLADRLIACISDPPGISTKELRRRFRRVSLKALQVLLRQLRQEGVIELCGSRRYRVPERSTALAASSHASSGFIRPPTLARLMAGR